MIRTWVIYGVALLAYIVGMMHRASLGVAGIEAAEHFGSTPSIVSTFVVLQLAVYALAQVPVGTLLDRFGPRVMITAGSLVMASGQLLLGSVDVLPLAYLARILVGLGDACIYISCLALIPRWFKPSVAPLMAQLTGLISVFGQLLAIYGLLPLILWQGWQVGLTAAATLGAVVATAAAAVIRDAPDPIERRATPLSEINKGLWETLKHPGTQLGFFIHYTAGFSLNAFMFMWGLPYMQKAQGLSQGQASFMFMLLSVSGIVFGPVIGILTARHPLRRSNLALTVIWAALWCWVAILLWPGPAPLWLVTLLVLSLAAGGPGTAVGFDFPRTSLPTTRLGVANGIVISGAFLGATLTILLIGTVLEFTSGGASTYSFAQWQTAMSVQVPLYVIGLIGIYVTRARLRRRMREAGVVVPPWREAIARRWRSRRRRRR